jgi:hypothetical protein
VQEAFTFISFTSAWEASFYIIRWGYASMVAITILPSPTCPLKLKLCIDVINQVLMQLAACKNGYKRGLQVGFAGPRT